MTVRVSSHPQQRRVIAFDSREVCQCGCQMEGNRHRAISTPHISVAELLLLRDILPPL